MWQNFKDSIKRKSISKCVVPSCPTKLKTKDSKITLFSFPKDQASKKTWCDNLGITDHWMISKYDKLRVCSIHFAPQFLNWAGNRYILASKDAAPNIITENLEQKDANPPIPTKTYPSTSFCPETELEECTNSSTASICFDPEIETEMRSFTSEQHSQESFIQSEETEEYGELNVEDNSWPSSEGSTLLISERPSTAIGICSTSSYTSLTSEYIPKTKYLKLQDRLLAKNKQIHNLKRQLNRNVEKTISLTDILEKLKSERLMDDDIGKLIKYSAKEVPVALFQRYASNESMDKIIKTKYSKELKTFAHTLHFYSPKAYNYVRDVFKCALPHPDTVRRWYSKVDGSPGFTQQALNSIKLKATFNKQNGMELCVALMLDEMSIMRKTELVGGRLIGQVDLGIDYSTDCEKEAVEALVVMAVSMTDHWKIPIAYFLINGITASLKTEIVSMAIERLFEAGAKVVSITCDGLFSNQCMLENLGAVLCVNEAKPWFYFNGNPLQKIFVHLDPCHMLKLIRNRLFSEKEIITEEGPVRWRYISELHDIQMIEEFKLGNKLSKAHVHFQQKKMKVSLAAQTMSESVATAIEFCNQDLRLPQFAESEPTVKFIRKINLAFDLLNSRNPFGKGSKAPIGKNNVNHWMPMITKITSYLSSIKLNSDVSIYSTNKCTGFLGVYLGLFMLQSLYKDYIETNYLKYLLTYKLSQDHLELFFCAMRSRSGNNNNPTPRQFIAGYKQLLVHTQVKNLNGNVGETDETEVLGVCSLPVSRNDGEVQYPIDMFDLDDNNANTTNSSDRDNMFVSEFLKKNSISPFQENVIGYISGYVVRMTQKIIKCTPCINSLHSEYGGARPTALSLLFKKTRGGLVIPSKDVTDLCIITNRYFKTANINLKLKNQDERLALRILCDLNIGELFPSLHNHQFDTEIDNNHIYKLSKTIIKCFIKIKFSQISKEINDANTTQLRQQLSRLIIFRHE